jgi:uncharacterized membrane protein
MPVWAARGEKMTPPAVVILHRIAIILLGLISGANVLILGPILAFWRGLSAKDLQAWFITNEPNFRQFLTPLGVATLVATILTALVAWNQPAFRRGWLVASVVCFAGVVGVTALGNFPINDILVSSGTRTMAEWESAALLRRWEHLHWIRTLLGLASLVCMLGGWREK